MGEQLLRASNAKAQYGVPLLRRLTPWSQEAFLKTVIRLQRLWRYDLRSEQGNVQAHRIGVMRMQSEDGELSSAPDGIGQPDERARCAAPSRSRSRSDAAHRLSRGAFPVAPWHWPPASQPPVDIFHRLKAGGRGQQ